MSNSCKCCDTYRAGLTCIKPSMKILIQALDNKDDVCERCSKMIDIINDHPELRLELEKFITRTEDL